VDTKSTLLTQYLTLLQLKLNCKSCSYKTAGRTVACKFCSSFFVWKEHFSAKCTLFLCSKCCQSTSGSISYPILVLFVFQIVYASPLYYTTAPKEEISFYYKLDIILALIWAVCMVPHKIVNLVVLVVLSDCDNPSLKQWAQFVKQACP